MREGHMPSPVNPEDENRAPPLPLQPPEQPGLQTVPPLPGRNDQGELLPWQVLHGRYRIMRQIGRGGMGRVYQAEHIELQKPVAIKEAIAGNPDLLDILSKEARLLVQLEHVALPHVTDYFIEQSRQYLVMEYIPGDDLYQMLVAQKQPFPVDAVLDWAEQLLAALDYLHSQQPPVIHRDIKPNNLKLKSNRIILLDFGLAKATQASVIGSTPQYAPPEQLSQGGTDARSDLYSLAATLQHLLTYITHRPPVNTIERQTALSARRADPLRPAHELNPAVPPAVSRWLLQAMALEKDRRPASARVMLEELKQIRKGVVVTPNPPLVKILLIGTLVLTLAVLGIWFREPLIAAVGNLFQSAPPVSAQLQNQIVFTTDRDGNQELYVMNADGMEQRNLTNNPAKDTDAAISGDGTAIAFVSDRDGSEQIYRMAADGSNIQVVTTGRSPAWAPDNTQIVFERDGDICVIGQDGSNERCLTSNAEQDRDPDWSRDDRIAFERNNDIYVMNADGGGLENITNTPQTRETKPAWSPISSHIVFTSDEGDGVDDIYYMNANGENRTNLTRNPNRADSNPAWSPDDSHIVYRSTTSDRKNEIFVIHINGTEDPVRLTENDSDDTAPVWSPE